MIVAVCQNSQARVVSSRFKFLLVSAIDVVGKLLNARDPTNGKVFQITSRNGYQLDAFAYVYVIVGYAHASTKS